MAYTAIKDWLQDEIKNITETGLYKHEKVITTSQGSEVGTTEGDNINFCANNYLGLADSPEIIDAVCDGCGSMVTAWRR